MLPGPVRIPGADGPFVPHDSVSVSRTASHKGVENMKRRTVACMVALVAIEAFNAGLACVASARSSRPEAMTTGDSATIVSDLDMNGLMSDRGAAGSDFVRPNYGAPECTTDSGLGYARPCNRPGYNY